jgi:transcriptional regulator with XRE-family HTH domain
VEEHVIDTVDMPDHIGGAEVRVAARMRRLRTDKGMTLADLAERSGISSPFLSRVENHKASLTIAGLERVAAALGVPMSVFFEADELSQPIVICRSGTGRRTRLRGPNGLLLEMLAADKRGKLMEPLLVDLETASDVTTKSHPGEEFNFVLSGECELTFGDQTIRLLAGDSVYYDASVPHAARVPAGLRCRLLSIVASRDYLFHGDLTRLLNAGEA